MASREQLEAFANNFNLRSRSEILTVKKCSELQEKKHYAIFALRKTETAVGQGVVAVLGDSPYHEGDVPKFQVYLPKRQVNFLMNEDLNLIAPGMLYLVSHGPSNNSTELTIHLSKND